MLSHIDWKQFPDLDTFLICFPLLYSNQSQIEWVQKLLLKFSGSYQNNNVSKSRMSLRDGFFWIWIFLSESKSPIFFSLWFTLISCQLTLWRHICLQYFAIDAGVQKRAVLYLSIFLKLPSTYVCNPSGCPRLSWTRCCENIILTHPAGHSL